MNESEKTRAGRLSRMVRRQGLTVMKSRLRDPEATGYGGYMIAKATSLSPGISRPTR
jgi:hypothetical protein